MNRQQRRAAAKSGKPLPEAKRSDPAATAGSAAPARPGLLLRIAAKILLAPWILNRVSSPDVERMLANMALEAGKPEIAKSLLNRIAMRKPPGR